MFCYVITSELSTVLSPPTQPNLDTYINFQISNGAYYAHLNLCFQPRDCLTTSLTNGSVSKTKHCPQYITLPKYDPLGKLAQKRKILKLALVAAQTLLVYMLILLSWRDCSACQFNWRDHETVRRLWGVCSNLYSLTCSCCSRAIHGCDETNVFRATNCIYDSRWLPEHSREIDVCESIICTLGREPYSFRSMRIEIYRFYETLKVGSMYIHIP